MVYYELADETHMGPVPGIRSLFHGRASDRRMVRDWGVTGRLVELRPDGSIPLWELLALPGDLFFIVGMLFALGLTELVRGIRGEYGEGTLLPDRVGVLVGVVFGGLALIVLLEAVVGASRPPTDWHAIDASPYGFPSGHTMAATIMWGAVAWLYRPEALPIPAVVGGVGLVIFVVGLSRLFLGVHYVPDVLAAVVVGVMYLGMVIGLQIDRPWQVLLVALAVAIAAMGVAMNDRAMLGLLGTVGAIVGWTIIQHDVVASQVQTLGK